VSIEARERDTERRLLQVAASFACLVPLSMGLASVLEGPEVLQGVSTAPVDLDSHFRYLSGLLLGIGVAFASCIPRIEAKTALFQTLGLIVVAGAAGRALSLVEAGVPSFGHLFGLVMELCVVPLLMLWQLRVARLHKLRRPAHPEADEAALA
jgi:hypothetical protein